MKKISLLLIFAFIVNISLKSQTLLNQNFNGDFPPTGWTSDNQFSSNWSQSNTDFAGGTVPELQFGVSVGTGTARFISPVINLTGNSTVLLSFNQTVMSYSSSVTIGVATRTGIQEIWSNVWSQDNANINNEFKQIIINNSNTNLDEFQFCFYITGNMNDIQDWYIDNVKLIAPLMLDLEMISTDIENFILPGNITLTGLIHNVGFTTLSNFDICWSIDNGEVNTTNISGLNLELGNVYDYTCIQQWNATLGSHILKVWLANPNGESDNDNGNDSIIKNVFVATQLTSKPLFEEFSSSTCGPCADFNIGVFAPWENNHIGDFSLIKYQMNWPYPGDIYFTDEGRERKIFYDVFSVPEMCIDGDYVVDLSNDYGLNYGFNLAQNRIACMSIDIAPSYSGTTVSVPVTVNPYLNANNLTLQVVICEKTTFNNVGTNGETSFKNVMMKMFPNAAGTLLNLTAGIQYSNIFTQDMAETNVEEMSDLVAVVFVQDNLTKQVLQSNEQEVVHVVSINQVSTNNIEIFPNPATDFISFTDIDINSTIQIFDVSGKLLLELKSSNNQINISNLKSGIYFMKIQNSNEIVMKKFIKQ